MAKTGQPAACAASQVVLLSACETLWFQAVPPGSLAAKANFHKFCSKPMLARLVRQQASAMRCTCMQHCSLRYAGRQPQRFAKQCCIQLSAAATPAAGCGTSCGMRCAAGPSPLLSTASSAAGSGAATTFSTRRAQCSRQRNLMAQHPAGSRAVAAMRGVPRGGLCKGLPLDAALSHAPESRYAEFNMNCLTGGSAASRAVACAWGCRWMQRCRMRPQAGVVPNFGS